LAYIKEAIELVPEEYESQARKESGKLIPIILWKALNPVRQRIIKALTKSGSSQSARKAVK